VTDNSKHLQLSLSQKNRYMCSDNNVIYTAYMGDLWC